MGHGESFTTVWQNPRISSSWRRLASTARHHFPLVAFVAFATIVVCLVHLPWSTASLAMSSSSPLRTFPRYGVAELNKTVPLGHGTLKIEPNTTLAEKRPKFAKIAVASGFEDILYEKALQTHVDHAEKWAYPLYVARENAADGMFNKVAFIINVLLNELYKPAEERVEWLFYFDVDSIIVNQEVPLEVFIPPSDFSHINYMAGRDWNGLNAGVLMLRVCQWSLNLLTRTMTYKHYHPERDYTFEEQSILAYLTEEDDDFKKEMIYVPRGWFNAYFYQLHEAKPGLLLSHFPHPDYKWHIYEWLKILEADKDEEFDPVYNKPLEQTVYPGEVKRFWQAKRRVEKAMKGFERNIQRNADPVKFGLQHQETKELAKAFQDKYDALKGAARFKTDEPEELEKMVDEAEELNAKLIEKLMEYFQTHDDPPPQAGF